MRMLIVAVATAIALAGCSLLQPSNPMPAGRAGVLMDGTGTLASIDTCEYEIAPLYTRLIVLRKAAARGLDAGRITIDQAKQVQANSDAARALLDRACPDGRTGKKVDRDAVDRAAKLIGATK